MPEPFPTDRLCAGQVGYIITGMKTTKNAQIGDTWFRYKQPVEALPGFKPSKSMVFAGGLSIPHGLLRHRNRNCSACSDLRPREQAQTALSGSQKHSILSGCL